MSQMFIFYKNSEFVLKDIEAYFCQLTTNAV